MKRNKNLTAWLLMAVLWIMTACASSHRTVGESHTERQDSLTSVSADSTFFASTSVDSVAKSSGMEQAANGIVSQQNDSEETVTERIIEQTDTRGNKTTTTDRTIHRKGKFLKQETYGSASKTWSEELSTAYKRLDSLSFANNNITGTHWEKNDSSFQNKEKNTATDRTTSWWGRFKLQMRAFIYAFIMIVVCFLATKYRKQTKK